mgnify:CR=1 FL=1
MVIPRPIGNNQVAEVKLPVKRQVIPGVANTRKKRSFFSHQLPEVCPFYDDPHASSIVGRASGICVQTMQQIPS